MRLVIGVVVLSVVLLACSSMSDEECYKDSDCAESRWEIDALAHCEIAVENQARYASRWTDGFLESKFGYIWRPGTRDFRMYGNKAQFQNAFGAWQKVSYICHYSPVDDQVTYVSVN